MLGKRVRYTHIVLLISILLLSFVLRIVWINEIPMSLNPDELYYLMHAKSFFFTGKDLYQTIPLWKIFIFQYPSNGMPQAELPFLIQTILSGFPSSFFIQALPNILMSVGSVFCLYFIGKKLFNQNIGLLTALCMAINPWTIFIGRTSYEMVGAVFFILAGYSIILRCKGQKILFSIPLFALAFYSYIGTKIIIVPLLCIFFIGNYILFHNKKDVIWQAIIVLFFVFLSIFYFLQVSRGGLIRLGEITTPIHPLIAEQVNTIRKNTINSPLLSLFVNKNTIYLSVLVKLFFQTLSPVYLFFEGDYISALGNQGLFYSFDIVFLLIGFAQLWKKYMRHLCLIIVICIVATFPQIIHDATGLGGNFTPHIVVLIPFFLLVISYGIHESVLFFKKRKFFIGIGFIFIIYGFQFVAFIHSYFFQYPFHNGLFNLTTHITTQYISRSKKPIDVYMVNPKLMFEQYIYSENKFTKDSAESVINAYGNNNLTVDNISFHSCDEIARSFSDDKTSIVDAVCDKKPRIPELYIASPQDSGTAGFIYHDSLCVPYQLPLFISGLSLRALDLPSLTDKEFCEFYIMK